MRFVEWKPREALPLPSLLAEPSPQFENGRVVGLPLPTLLSIAPRFDAAGAARGLLATRGEVEIGAASSSGEDSALQLKAQIAAAGSGADFEAPAPAPPQGSDALENARAAWRDLRAARQKGDWNGVARAEKTLGNLLESE